MSERIKRLRKRYQTEMPKISIERAKYYTDKWFETENSGTPQNIRVALSMKNVYKNMTHYLDPDDRIAGYWTEDFMGIPIDIERGVFNKVLETELSWWKLLRFRIGAILKSFKFLREKEYLRDFLQNNKRLRKEGSQPLNFGVKTMEKRKINPFKINKKDKKVLLKKLLPKWNGKMLVNILEDEIPKAGILSGSMVEFSNAMPANTSRQTKMISMCATISTYQGHVIIDYETPIKKGLLKMKEEIEVEIENSSSLSSDDLNTLKSLKIAIEGVIIFAERLAEQVESEYQKATDSTQKAILKRMLDNCKKVPL